MDWVTVDVLVSVTVWVDVTVMEGVMEGVAEGVTLGVTVKVPTTGLGVALGLALKLGVEVGWYRQSQICRTRPLRVSATSRLPLAFHATPHGPLTVAAAAEAWSPLNAPVPRPARVLMKPLAACTLRMRWLAVSAM